MSANFPSRLVELQSIVSLYDKHLDALRVRVPAFRAHLWYNLHPRVWYNLTGPHTAFKLHNHAEVSWMAECRDIAISSESKLLWLECSVGT